MKYIGNLPSTEIVQTYADKFDYINPSDPAVSTNPSSVYATWLNTTSGVIFVCTDNTAGANVWESQRPAFRGALLTDSSAQSVSNATPTVINWDTESYDTDSFHDNATNNSRITIPSGVTKVRFGLSIRWASNATGGRQIEILQDGTTVLSTLGGSYVPPVNGVRTVQTFSSPVISVSSGEYYEARVYQTSGGALNADVDDRSWFSIEVIE